MPRTLPRALPALLLSATAVLVGAVPAEAGGPTSVLLASPTHQTTASLHYTDARYAELEQLLHAEGALVGEPAGEPVAATWVNVTWLLHDVMVWRVDSLAFDGDGSAWVSTTNECCGGEQPASTSGWLRVRKADRVREVVVSLGLFGNRAEPSAAASPASREEATAGSPAVAVEAPPVVREETRWFSLTGWRWAVPGLLLGLVGAGLALRRDDGAPRHELVDRPPATTPG